MVLWAAGSQAKISCRNIQLFAGLEGVIEGATYEFQRQKVSEVDGAGPWYRGGRVRN